MFLNVKSRERHKAKGKGARRRAKKKAHNRRRVNRMHGHKLGRRLRQR